LDILTFGEMVLEEEGLAIPHPEMAVRAFVLEPLRELDPEFVHPATGKAVEEMLKALPKGQKAEKIGPLGGLVGP
jgi:7,8-dihydro-6-hydroxymethylpterin-pyrophosphokinase